jgi:hypothetical protein
MRRTLGLCAGIAVALFLVGGPGVALGQAQPPQQDKEKAAAADPVSGDWDGSVEMSDGPMAFSMKLKLDKDKVTGEISGPQGTATFSEGSWSKDDAKLSISFTYVDGASVSMTGALKEGQLTGSLDYGGGQMLLNWSAKKRTT